MNLSKDLQLTFVGQPVEHVGDLAELLEVKLAQVLPVLFFDERVSVGQQNLVHVEVISLEELLQCLLLDFLFVCEEHLSC